MSTVNAKLRGLFLCTALAGLWQHFPALAVCQEPQHANHALSSYILGPGDQLTFSGVSAEEIATRPYSVDADGEVDLPMVGRLRASGLTLRQFEQQLNKRLATYIREPQVVTSITEFRSQPVSVVGAVKTPGTHQLEGEKSLMEMIALAGGFTADTGNVIEITRELEWGTIPLPNATTDSSNRFNLANVNIKQLLDGKDPAANIVIMPHDVISVPKAELVYVVGGVVKAGGFVLAERENMSVLQALSLAQGLERTADSKHARVLRLQADQVERVEITVDLKKILDGRSKDVALRGGDILFVPDSTAKRVQMKTMDAIVQTAVGVAIWRP